MKERLQVHEPAQVALGAANMELLNFTRSLKAIYSKIHRQIRNVVKNYVF